MIEGNRVEVYPSDSFVKKTNIGYKVHRNKLNRVTERIKSLKLY